MNRTIQIRLAKTQLETVRVNAQRYGFATVSAFLRHLALEQENQTHERVRRIYEHLLGAQQQEVVEKKPARKFKANPAALSLS